MEHAPTRDDVDALVGPATPHFAYQLRARVRELVADLPADHDVRRYAEAKIDLLDRLGYASSKAEEGGREPHTRPGWAQVPSGSRSAICATTRPPKRRPRSCGQRASRSRSCAATSPRSVYSSRWRS